MSTSSQAQAVNVLELEVEFLPGPTVISLEVLFGT